MNCPTCNPLILVTCHDDPTTDKYLLKISGLANGDYFWRVHYNGHVYAKPFTHVDGTDIEILATDLPAGFTTTAREFSIDIVSDMNGAPLPFDFTHSVSEIDVEIHCPNGSFFPETETIGK